MQAEERGVDTGISNTQIDESYPYEKHKSGREMPGNSHVSHEESVNEESVISLPEIRCIRSIPKIKRCVLMKNHLTMENVKK